MQRGQVGSDSDNSEKFVKFLAGPGEHLWCYSRICSVCETPLGARMCVTLLTFPTKDLDKLQCILWKYLLKMCLMKELFVQATKEVAGFLVGGYSCRLPSQTITMGLDQIASAGSFFTPISMEPPALSTSIKAYRHHHYHS